ncbi:MAG: methylcobalamin:coenzyme M methyltransferase [Lentisphaerae bacterium ADurb.BinA184]|nr:MAG: methylcobalamin:coenzyme M methyltransferase [Lentisphaerae bacterium ADurb.BinA184]
MTPKERWLAAIHMQPVDRLPFWPKLSASYAPAQAEPFRGMTLDALHNWMGSDRHGWVGTGLREVRTTTRLETAERDGVHTTFYHTPHGDLRLVQRFDAASQSWHPVEFPVKTRGDLAVMTAFWRDVRIEVDAAGLAAAREQCRRAGGDQLLGVGIGESPLMQWVEWLAGIENAHYLLADHPDEVEELFAAIHAGLVRKAQVMAEKNPADVFYMTENTSTTLISPDQFRRHCLRHLTEYGRILDAAGRPLVLHMCGHLKALLPDLAKVPARAFEAFTSPTLGNTTLLDGRTHCPHTCLIGGTNAMLWTRPAAEIIARIQADLDVLPHHRGLVVTSAGVMPPLCRPDTIREVCEWVKAHPARMQ